MGRATPLLSGRRLAAFAVVGTAVGSYYVWRKSLPDLPFWWDVGLLIFPIIPVVLLLVLAILPLWRAPVGFLAAATVVLALAAALCETADFQLAANFAKLFAPVFAGWLFLYFFEQVSWVVLVAVIVPFVDAYSVFWGPTRTITTKHIDVYSSVAFTFIVPNHSGAQLGPPDLLFFALFLGAAQRFGLRVLTTFALMALSFGATIAISAGANLAGLPALPLLSIGFLLANADLLWRLLRRMPST